MLILKSLFSIDIGTLPTKPKNLFPLEPSLLFARPKEEHSDNDTGQWYSKRKPEPPEASYVHMAKIRYGHDATAEQGLPFLSASGIET
jgi:hypothetical protein